MATVRVYVVEKPHEIDSVHFGCRRQAEADGWQIICQSYGPDYELWFRTCPVCGQPFSSWPGQRANNCEDVRNPV